MAGDETREFTVECRRLSEYLQEPVHFLKMDIEGYEDVVLAELGPHEGIFIPRNFPYWFEKIGDEPMEVLQVEAIDRSVKNLRTDYKEQKASAASVRMFDLDGGELMRGILNPGEDDDG